MYFIIKVLNKIFSHKLNPKNKIMFYINRLTFQVVRVISSVSLPYFYLAFILTYILTELWVINCLPFKTISLIRIIRFVSSLESSILWFVCTRETYDHHQINNYWYLISLPDNGSLFLISLSSLSYYTLLLWLQFSNWNTYLALTFLLAF